MKTILGMVRASRAEWAIAGKFSPDVGRTFLGRFRRAEGME
jgi:hypothetical protein